MTSGSNGILLVLMNNLNQVKWSSMKALLYGNGKRFEKIISLLDKNTQRHDVKTRKKVVSLATLFLGVFFKKPMFKTALTWCLHILKTLKKVMDRPPVHTKIANFLLANFENGRFWKRNSNWQNLKEAASKHSSMMKTERFSTLQNKVHLFGIGTFQRVCCSQISYCLQNVPASFERGLSS